MYTIHRTVIQEAWENRVLLRDSDVQKSIRFIIDELDAGKLRVAEPGPDGWKVNDWIKKAVILYFPIQQMSVTEVGPFEFHDKIVLKKNYKNLGVRVVPHAIARHGSYLAKGVILMPSYVNIGAYVDEGTMVDTWATVGSCAQVGKHVHLSGGVGIGGVLEPVQAAPVIVEDNCFIGSRCIIVEGAYLEKEVVLAANVVITKSYPRKYPAGEYGVSCALIIGKRKESTDKKTSLNDALREYNIAF
jgi:2,3,4,5-tetrahydropyridine-2-carboxylate N-succinyltransferase